MYYENNNNNFMLNTAAKYKMVQNVVIAYQSLIVTSLVLFIYTFVHMFVNMA